MLDDRASPSRIEVYICSQYSVPPSAFSGIGVNDPYVLSLVLYLRKYSIWDTYVEIMGERVKEARYVLIDVVFTIGF